MTNQELGLHLYGAASIDHDVHQIYGYNNFSFPKRFEGFYVWAFTKTAAENFAPYEMSEKRGKVTLNGKAIPFEYVKKESGWNPWLVAVDLRKLRLMPGENYTITISNFETRDGEIMEPVETHLHCLPKGEKAEGTLAEHEKMTLLTAQEGAVLLKNEGKLLPLTEKKINVFGEAYYRFYHMSGGAGCINPRYSIGFLEGLKEYGQFVLNPEMEDFFYGETIGEVPDKEMLQRAKAYSKTAVLTISRGSKEDTDNDPEPGGYYLTPTEERLIEAVSEVFDETIAILNVGHPIDVRWIEKYKIKAVLWFGYAGQSAGAALANVLSGSVTPSGHLPDTWAYDYGDYASSRNYILNRDIPEGCNDPLVTNVYEEGIYVGYRYFDTFGVPVAYPFGYGLSYTEFENRFLSADYENGILCVQAAVKNIGEMEGKQVLQLYVKEPDGRLEKCAHKLLDFQKTSLLKPGEEGILSFEAADTELCSFDEGSASMVMEAGTYQIFLGEHIGALTEVFSFTLQEEKCVRKLHHYCLAKEMVGGLTKGGSSFFNAEEKAFDFSKTERKHFSVPSLPEYDGEKIDYEMLEHSPELLDQFVAQMSVAELARLCVCAQAWAIDANGVAGSVYTLEKYGMKPFYTADGNATLRMHKQKTGFPCSNMICASFNREMAYTVGRVIAEEAYEEKIHMILAPGMNIHRNPMCGRNAEYFSEDPVLCGIMAGYHMKGLQEHQVGAAIKHIIANNAELSRYRSHSVVGERALREIYVKCFEIAMRIEMPDGMMTAYNAMNDCYTGSDEELILGIFREELGFEGFVMTDWNSYNTCDPAAAVAAGNCWLTPGGTDDTYPKILEEAVADGRISLGRLQDNVKRLLRVMIKYASIEEEV